MTDDTSTPGAFARCRVPCPPAGEGGERSEPGEGGLRLRSAAHVGDRSFCNLMHVVDRARNGLLGARPWRTPPSPGSSPRAGAGPSPARFPSCRDSPMTTRRRSPCLSHASEILTGNGIVDVADLLAVILDWGTDGAANGGDVNNDGEVNVVDIVAVINGWGVCFPV